MKLLEILKRMLSCATTETSEPTEVSKSTVLPLVDSNKESKDYADLDDIRLVVGDKTLALVYNVCMGGLHNVLHYDPCSHDTQDCFSEINAIIEKNLEEAYESIVVKTGENQYLLNEPTLKSKACLKCLYFTIIIFDLCRYLEYPHGSPLPVFR